VKLEESVIKHSKKLEPHEAGFREENAIDLESLNPKDLVTVKDQSICWRIKRDFHVLKRGVDVIFDRKVDKRKDVDDKFSDAIKDGYNKNSEDLKELKDKHISTSTSLSSFTYLLPFITTLRYLLNQCGIILYEFKRSPYKNTCLYKQLRSMNEFKLSNYLGNKTYKDEEDEKIVLRFCCRKLHTAEKVEFFIVVRFDKNNHIISISDCYSTDLDLLHLPLSVVLDCMVISASSYHLFLACWIRNKLLTSLLLHDIWDVCFKPVGNEERRLDPEEGNNFVVNIHRSLIGYLLARKSLRQFYCDLRPIVDRDGIIGEYYLVHGSNLLIAKSYSVLKRTNDSKNFIAVLDLLPVSTYEWDRRNDLLSWLNVIDNCLSDLSINRFEGYYIKFKPTDPLTVRDIRSFGDTGLNWMVVSLSREDKLKLKSSCIGFVNPVRKRTSKEYSKLISKIHGKSMKINEIQTTFEKMRKHGLPWMIHEDNFIHNNWSKGQKYLYDNIDSYVGDLGIDLGNEIHDKVVKQVIGQCDPEKADTIDLIRAIIPILIADFAEASK
jgi:hypothetical protein